MKVDNWYGIRDTKFIRFVFTLSMLRVPRNQADGSLEVWNRQKSLSSAYEHSRKSAEFIRFDYGTRVNDTELRETPRYSY